MILITFSEKKDIAGSFQHFRLAVTGKLIVL